MTGSGKRRDHRSWIAEGGQSTIAPASFAALGGHDLRRLAEGDALALVELGQALHGAVQVDRLVVAGLPQERHDPLRLAERIGADDMGALRETGATESRSLRTSVARVRMAEDRQAEGRLGDEDVAGHDLVGQAGRVAARL